MHRNHSMVIEQQDVKNLSPSQPTLNPDFITDNSCKKLHYVSSKDSIDQETKRTKVASTSYKVVGFRNLDTLDKAELLSIANEFRYQKIKPQASLMNRSVLPSSVVKSKRHDEKSVRSSSSLAFTKHVPLNAFVTMGEGFFKDNESDGMVRFGMTHSIFDSATGKEQEQTNLKGKLVNQTYTSFMANDYRAINSSVDQCNTTFTSMPGLKHHQLHSRDYSFESPYERPKSLDAPDKSFSIQPADQKKHAAYRYRSQEKKLKLKKFDRPKIPHIIHNS